LHKIIFKKNDFIYLDPPYLITNATYNSIWSKQKENELFQTLDFLNERGIKWALSNIIESKGNININLKSWIEKNKYTIHELDFNYKNSNYQRKNKGKDVEVLITN
jgi:site-specific DNA-adenine methylase